MIKFSLSFILLIGSISIFSQTKITLSFLDKETISQNLLTLDSVYIKNIRRDCDTTLYGSDSKLTVNASLTDDLNDLKTNSSSEFILNQNFSNSFNETSNVDIYRNYSGPLNLFLFDCLGRKLSEYHSNFDKGFNSFTISSSEHGVLILVVYDDKNKKSLKLICSNQSQFKNKINYNRNISYEEKVMLKGQAISGFRFSLGDQMSYTASAKGYSDQTITDKPKADTKYIFIMSEDSLLTPTEILKDGNTVAWYDASDLTTIVKDGSNIVSRWKDKYRSGRDFIQATKFAQPLWSPSGILFDGINDCLKASFTLSQPEFIYIVFKIKTFTSSRCILDGYNNSSCSLSMSSDRVGNIELHAGTSSTETSFPINQNGILRIKLNGTTSRMQVNELVSIAGNYGPSNLSGLTLGSTLKGINYSNIEVKDIIVRKVADTLKDENEIYSYLKRKNGIVSDNLIYETLSEAVYLDEPYKTTIGNVNFIKTTQTPVNCGISSTFKAKNIEDSYSIENDSSTIHQTLSNPRLMRFVEDNINCEVFCISDKYIYYGHSSAFWRINKNTFGDKVKFLISGLWGNGTNVSTSAIEGVNEMPDMGLLIQVDNNSPNSPFYKVPFINQTSGKYTYLASDAQLVMTIPVRHAILNKAWGLSTKGDYVFAVLYGAIGQAYLSKDSGNSFRCVFSMADSSINASVPSDKMVYVDTKPNGSGGFGAIGGHPMKNTLTNPQTYDLWAPTSNGNLHSHGGCIDLYSDRLFIVTGDGYPAVGIYYSDDWGYNWTQIKTINLIPSTKYTAQFVNVVTLQDCILFGCDGMGDGYWRLFRKGNGLCSEIEECYQFNGSNTELVTINGGYCFTSDGLMLGLINPEGSDDYTTIKGGIVATKNGHNFKKLYEDSFTRLTRETAEFGWRGIISVNDNNKVLVKAANGGLIILDLVK
jgi:hypothetical protein